MAMMYKNEFTITLNTLIDNLPNMSKFVMVNFAMASVLCTHAKINLIIYSASCQISLPKAIKYVVNYER